MSASAKLKQPAHIGLRPRPPAAGPVDPAFAELIRGLPVSKCRRLASPADAPCGHYLMLWGEGEPLPVFGKVIPAAEVEGQLAADRLAKAAADTGIAASVLLAGSPIRIGDRYALLLYRQFAGRFARLGRVDLRRLGRETARLQLALAPLAQPMSLGDATAQWIDELSGLREKCLAGLPGSARWLRAVLASWPELTASVLHAAEPCHGDLNAGNILVEAHGGVVFLDFEDALHSCFWPGFDVAKLVERLILVEQDKLQEGQKLRAGLRLVAGYRECREPIDVLAPTQLSDALRWHIGASVILILARGRHSQPVWQAELEKMRLLSRLVNTNSVLLNRVGEALAR